MNWRPRYCLSRLLGFATAPINLINLENVSKSYGIKPLLSNVSLGVQAGDRIGVVGLNGGGKTTLLEILSGLEPADEGRVSRTTDLRQAVVTQRETPRRDNDIRRRDCPAGGC